MRVNGKETFDFIGFSACFLQTWLKIELSMTRVVRLRLAKVLQQKDERVHGSTINV